MREAIRWRIRRFLLAATLAAAISAQRAQATDPIACTGDCNGDGQVTIDELLTGVEIALGGCATAGCPALECNRGLPGLGIFVNCAVLAVRNALMGCTEPPLAGGACCVGDCTAGTTNCQSEPQGACCNYARVSEIALAIWWCPPDAFDPETNFCAACVGPCLGLPPEPPAPTVTAEASEL